jgi:hypothetical protein
VRYACASDLQHPVATDRAAHDSGAFAQRAGRLEGEAMIDQIGEIEAGTVATIATINDLLARSIRSAQMARALLKTNEIADAADSAGRAMMLARLAELHLIRVIERRYCVRAAEFEIARLTP